MFIPVENFPKSVFWLSRKKLSKKLFFVIIRFINIEISSKEKNQDKKIALDSFDVHGWKKCLCDSKINIYGSFNIFSSSFRISTIRKNSTILINHDLSPSTWKLVSKIKKIDFLCLRTMQTLTLYIFHYIFIFIIYFQTWLGRDFFEKPLDTRF